MLRIKQLENKAMKEYDLTLIFKVDQLNINSQDYRDRLYEAGCDDAILGIGKSGYLSLNFIRESNSAFKAIKTACEDVRSVLVEAELIHVSPDLFGVKELGNILGCSRQNVQKFVNKSDFPLSVYQGERGIWHLATVLKWFIANDRYVDLELLEVAELALSINFQIAERTINPQVMDVAINLVILSSSSSQINS